MKSEQDKTLVGVLSKKDLSKPGKVVKDVYSSPPVAAKPDNKVADAACLMLKHKVHNGLLISRLRHHSYVLEIGFSQGHAVQLFLVGSFDAKIYSGEPLS